MRAKASVSKRQWLSFSYLCGEAKVRLVHSTSCSVAMATRKKKKLDPFKEPFILHQKCNKHIRTTTNTLWEQYEDFRWVVLLILANVCPTSKCPFESHSFVVTPRKQHFCTRCKLLKPERLYSLSTEDIFRPDFFMFQHVSSSALFFGRIHIKSAQNSKFLQRPSRIFLKFCPVMFLGA